MNLAIFQKEKIKALSKKDKSSKKTWDEKIKSLCDKINSMKEYYTTSSCSGRIILIKDSSKKKKNLILFRSHNKVRFAEIKKILEKIKKRNKNINFKQESCILHVVCSNIKNAQMLVDKARFAGWKRSGIIASRKRVVCELVSTEHIEMPIIRKGKILVNDSFLKILIEEANRKLERSWKKIKKLEKLCGRQDSNLRRH
ncbi:MAG: hypothetical protein QXE93_00180 [Candidatus Pacearchaeota archaeon]